MTEQELSARIAELNAQMSALKEERNKLVWKEGIPAIIAKMKRLGKDTICLRKADDEENCFHVSDIWGSINGTPSAANRLRLDENDNLILVYNDVTDYGDSWEYGDEDYESEITDEISNVIIAPNLNVIINDITDFYKQYRWPQDTSEIVDMKEMFKEREDLQSLDLRHFNTSHVTNMRLMFSECYKLQTIDLSTFDTSKVTDMAGMFAKCRALQSLDLSSFNTSKVTDMNQMFSNCSRLQSLDLSNFNTSKVTYMHNMFNGCNSLESLDLSNFVISEETEISDMFVGCDSLKTVIMRNCSDETVEKIKAQLPEGVEIIR